MLSGEAVRESLDKLYGNVGILLWEGIREAGTSLLHLVLLIQNPRAVQYKFLFITNTNTAS